MRTTPEQRAKFEDQIRSVIPRWLKEAYALDIAPDLLADLKDLEAEVILQRDHRVYAADLANKEAQRADRMRDACKALLERFDDMYDGAPDSRCGWMVPFIDELRKALK